MLLVIFIYISIGAFIIISLKKAIKFARMPMHSRWELYPVPLEKGRSNYGGSYYEELFWWEKPREVSRGGELLEMFKEMLFIKNLFKNQKSLWWLSYALHLGIYLLIAWAVLLFTSGLAAIRGYEVAATGLWWASLLYYLTFFTGAVGGLLVAFGSLSLFLRRLFDQNMKIYTTPQDYFNLIFILVVALTGLALWSGDPFFNGARNIVAMLLSFQVLPMTKLMFIHLVLLGCLLIYIPTSKMSHYVGKYFTFHKVLWENEPNLPGSSIMRAVEEAQGAKSTRTWSAPHFQSPQNKAPSQ